MSLEVQERQQAPTYLDRFRQAQLSVARYLLKTMLPAPVSRAPANAPLEDEEIELPHRSPRRTRPHHGRLGQAHRGSTRTNASPQWLSVSSGQSPPKPIFAASNSRLPYRYSERSAATSRPKRTTSSSSATSNHRSLACALTITVFCRDKGDHLEIVRVLDRKIAYR